MSFQNVFCGFCLLRVYDYDIFFSAEFDACTRLAGYHLRVDMRLAIQALLYKQYTHIVPPPPLLLRFEDLKLLELYEQRVRTVECFLLFRCLGHLRVGVDTGGSSKWRHQRNVTARTLCLWSYVLFRRPNDVKKGPHQWHYHYAASISFRLAVPATSESIDIRIRIFVK